MAHRARRISRPLLLLRPTQLVRHVSNVVRGAPAARPPAVDDLVDWVITTLGVLLLGKLTYALHHEALLTSRSAGRFRRPPVRRLRPATNHDRWDLDSRLRHDDDQHLD